MLLHKLMGKVTLKFILSVWDYNYMYLLIHYNGLTCCKAFRHTDTCSYIIELLSPLDGPRCLVYLPANIF